MIPQTQHDEEIVRLADVFREFIQSTGWHEFLRLSQSQRDRWILEAATNKDREFLAGCTYAINSLTNAPSAIIRQADEILAELSCQQFEASESSKTSSDDQFTVRPPPQPV